MIMYPPGSKTPATVDAQQVKTLLAAGWTHEPVLDVPLKTKGKRNASTTH